MSVRLLLASTLLVAAASVACNRAETPAKTQSDVAEAQREAVKNVDESINDGSYQIAMTAIEGEYKIAIEKCEALTGELRDACKDDASAQRKAAEERAKEAHKGT